MTLENNWYVYMHTRLDNLQPFYIGIGNKKNFARAYEFREDKRNEIWWKIFNKTQIKVDILFNNLQRLDACEKEKELIKKYGRKDLSEGSLSNMTDGGDGIWNCKRTEETKKKLSLQKLGNKNPQFGKKQSPELIEKRFKNIKGCKRDESTKLNQSISSIKSGQAKEVDVFKLGTGEFVGRFHAISYACRILGFHGLSSKASSVAKGKRKHTKGYVFKYVNE